MTIETSHALYLALAFLAPGFVVQSAMSMFVPQRQDEPRITLLRLLTLSCLNYAPWSPLILWMFKGDVFTAHLGLAVVLWFLMTFASPVMLGMILGHSYQRDWVRRFLIRLGLRPMHATPTAWDYKFQQQVARWILVTLQDGSLVAGWFGTKSFASSEPSERDLYLERLYRIGSDGAWTGVENGDGVLIRDRDIRRVEFWYDQTEGGR